MESQFEIITAPIAVENSMPLELQIPQHREYIARAMAGQAFLDGFCALEAPKSLFESMRKEMNDQIIEQPEAIDATISALDRWEVRADDDNQPAATLVFLGPTGVGKSQTAKVLADTVGGGKGNLIKINCTEYSSGHEVARLIGSPPGYVGGEIVAKFDKKRVEKAGTVVLFDELEKGATQLHNIMLQILDDGELQLSNGDIVSFRDAIIVVTSNLGAKELSKQMSSMSIGFGNHEPETNKAVLSKTAIKAFTDFFKPEFVNRFDKLVVFHPLSPKAIEAILAVKLNAVNKHYERKYGMKISLTDATVEHLVGIAQKEPQYGARPMVRAFKSNIESTFGRYQASEEMGEGTHIRVFHRSEFPEDYAHLDDRELIFAAKPDETIKRKARKGVLVFKKPVVAEESLGAGITANQNDPSVGPDINDNPVI